MLTYLKEKEFILSPNSANRQLFVSRVSIKYHFFLNINGKRIFNKFKVTETKYKYSVLSRMYAMYLIFIHNLIHSENEAIYGYGKRNITLISKSSLLFLFIKYYFIYLFLNAIFK